MPFSRIAGSMFCYCASLTASASQNPNQVGTRDRPQASSVQLDPSFCDTRAIAELARNSPGHARAPQSHLGFNNRVRKACGCPAFIGPECVFQSRNELTQAVSAGKTRPGVGGPETPASVPRTPTDASAARHRPAEQLSSVDAPLEVSPHCSWGRAQCLWFPFSFSVRKLLA